MVKKTVFLATLLATLLAIGAAPARAHHPHRDRHHGGVEATRLEVLSHQLEASVRRVERAAERRIHHRSRYERKALRALRRLARRADHFHARVERHPRSVRRLIADFRALDESFRVAEARAHRVHAPHLQRQLRRIGRLVARIDRELEHQVRLARHRGPGRAREHTRRVGRRERRSSYGEFAWSW
jgi:hypothetical protein